MSSQSYLFNPTERTLAAAGDGFSAPRLTTADRNALSLGVNGKGMMVYDTTLTTLCLWNGAAWEFISDNSNLFVSVKDYGAKGDGATDDTAAINSALAVVAVTGQTLFFPSGTYKITSRLDWDISKYTLLGDNATIDGSSSATGIIRVFGSAAYPDRDKKNILHYIQGFCFIGNQTTGFVSAEVGRVGGAYSSSNEICFRDCSFFAGGTLLNIVDNCWRLKMDRCSFVRAVDYYVRYASATNSSEVMEFNHCWMVDSGSSVPSSATVRLTDGQYYFDHLSIPGGGFGGFVVDGAAHVVVSNSNIETQPAAANQRLVTVSGSSLFVLDGCTFVFNTGVYNVTPLLANGAGCLRVINCTIPFFGDELKTEVTDLVRTFASGTSKYITFENNYVQGTGLVNSSRWCAASTAVNLLYNGGAETGNVNGWTASTYGVPGSTAVASAAAAKVGAFGFRVTAVAGGGILFSQSFSVGGRVGRTYLIGFWARAVAGVGNLSFPKVYTKSTTGNVITTNGAFAITGADTAWTWYGGFGIVEEGTSTITVELEGQALAGGCTIDFDSVILNII